MLKIIVSIMLSALIAGCANTNDVQLYGSVDTSNKTVTVQPGSAGLNGKLKQVLARDGWRLVVYRGPHITEGEVGEKVRIEQYDTYKTRYRLAVESRQFDLCLVTQSPAIFYDISFIDNKSGAEVFTISGKGCESVVVEKFMGALQGYDK